MRAPPAIPGDRRLARGGDVGSAVARVSDNSRSLAFCSGRTKVAPQPQFFSHFCPSFTHTLSLSLHTGVSSLSISACFARRQPYRRDARRGEAEGLERKATEANATVRSDRLPQRVNIERSIVPGVNEPRAIERPVVPAPTRRACPCPQGGRRFPRATARAITVPPCRVPSGTRESRAREGSSSAQKPEEARKQRTHRADRRSPAEQIDSRVILGLGR